MEASRSDTVQTSEEKSDGTTSENLECESEREDEEAYERVSVLVSTYKAKFWYCESVSLLHKVCLLWQVESAPWCIARI